MAQRRLYQVDRGTAIERVAGVGVSQPVGADVALDTGPPRRRPDDPPCLHGGERAALLRDKDRVISAASSRAASISRQVAAVSQHRARLAALAEQGHLPGVAARLHVTPAQAAQLRDPQAAGVE